MAVNLAELIVAGLLVDWLFRHIRIPGLIGILLVGVVFGPYALNLLDPSLAAISADLRMIALIVILLRAGLELSRKTLARISRMAILYAFVPASFEIAIVTLAGPPILGLTYLESAMLGAILGAVSPAVVVPLMLHFMERRMGAKKGICTLILAGSAADDVFVIVIYSVLVGVYTGQHVSIAWKVASVPLCIGTGILVGGILGWVFCRVFARFNPRATKRALALLGISVLLTLLEHRLENIVPFSALLAVMAIGFFILERREDFAHELSAKYAKIWIFAEIVLFTMVGAQVNVPLALMAGLAGAALIAVGLVGRSIGAYLCLLGSDFTLKERLFVVVAYIPKATVQAAIGAAPLAAMKLAGMNTQPGEIILTVAVLSILLTAPLGAWAISLMGNRILAVEPVDEPS